MLTYFLGTLLILASIRCCWQYVTNNVTSYHLIITLQTLWLFITKMTRKKLNRVNSRLSKTQITDLVQFN